jgi:two-component system, chemotaxis family, response regulator Rcp1
MSKRPVIVLLVEDNPADVGIMSAALRDAKRSPEIHVAADGEEALAFLHRLGRHIVAPLPDLVLLDLNLPKVDGFQVLEAMKADRVLRRIPVVVVSGSRREIDIARAYDAQISSYLIKPTGINEYFTVIQSLKELWFHMATLPPKDEAT